jgi:hypothetical protein
MKIELAFIPVTERLPVVPEGWFFYPCLVLTDEGLIDSSTFENGRFYDSWDEGREIGEVTHWCDQPLKK